MQYKSTHKSIRRTEDTILKRCIQAKCMLVILAKRADIDIIKLIGELPTICVSTERSIRNAPTTTAYLAGMRMLSQEGLTLHYIKTVLHISKLKSKLRVEKFKQNELFEQINAFVEGGLVQPREHTATPYITHTDYDYT